MIDNNKNNENISEAQDEKIYNISFEKRKTKASIRLGTKLIVYLILAGFSGAFFSNLIVKFKYGTIIQKFEQNINDDMVILDYTRIVDKVSPSIVTVGNSQDNVKNTSGTVGNITGVILDTSGNILTNYDGIKDFEETYVRFSSAASVPLKAKVIVKNPDIDIAIIKVETEEELIPIKFAKSESITVGQQIVTLGNSEGDEYIGSVIPGVITAIHEGKNIGSNTYSLIQVSTPIKQYNTGGPICNSKGELIGVASLNISDKLKDSGLYYGIALKELESIVSYTDALKSILGVTEGGILADESKEFKGFYVQEVDKNGSAYKAGIKPTDIIFEIDNKKVLSLDELIVVLENKKNGDVLKCKVLSDGKIKEINIQLNIVIADG